MGQCMRICYTGGEAKAYCGGGEGEHGRSFILVAFVHKYEARFIPSLRHSVHMYIAVELEMVQELRLSVHRLSSCAFLSFIAGYVCPE